MRLDGIADSYYGPDVYDTVAASGETK